MVGEIEKDDGVLVVKRIHVTYELSGVTEDRREAALRAHEHHAPRCPIARSIRDAIDITTELRFVDETA